MTAKITAFQTQRALWINRTGKRVYFNAHIINVSSSSIELSMTDSKGCENNLQLQSRDGFTYQGSITIGNLSYIFRFQTFSTAQDLVLFGHWSTGGFRGEMVIHSALRRLVTKDFAADKLPPAA